MQTGSMPDKYGSKPAAHLRFQELQQKGIWKKILSKLIKSARRQGRIGPQKVSIDSSSTAAKKGGDKIGYGGFKRISGTKIRVAVEQDGLPISIRTSPANQRDSTKFIDAMENISEFADNSLMQMTISAYADKGHDAKQIRNYLRCCEIDCCIPYKRNSKSIAQNRSQRHHGKTRFVVERFLAWLRCGFHGTAVRCEKNCENYLGFVYLASIMMYWRALG